jgi:hypothetical protein
MSRVAEGHFPEETRSVLDIEGKHGTIQRPFLDMSPATIPESSARLPVTSWTAARAQRLVIDDGGPRRITVARKVLVLVQLARHAPSGNRLSRTGTAAPGRRT